MEGNNKAMREALEFIKLASDDWELYGKTIAGALDVIYEKACAALAAPPRNCDVGTAYEQSDRFAEFCRKHADGCGLGYGSRGVGHPRVSCPAFKGLECALVWAQMSCGEGGAS